VAYRRIVLSLLLPLLLGSSLPAAAAQPLRADAEYRFLIAKSLAEEGRLLDALAELDRALAAAGDEPYLRLERAALLFQLGRLDEAAEEAAAARVAAPADPDVLRLQGRIELARSDERPEAAAIAREALEALHAQRPDDLEALLSLGQLYLAADQPLLAVETLEEAARLRPGHPWIESLRARALAAAGDARSAEKLQRQALARDANDLSARFELAERMGMEGRHEEAAALLEEAPERQRGRLDLRERLSRQLLLAGAPERALPIAEGVVAARPEFAPARLTLAHVQAALGYFEAAERTLEPLELVADRHEVITDLRVRALVGQGRYEAAVAVLEQRRTAIDASEDQVEAARLALETARIWWRAGEWRRVAEIALEVAATAVDPDLGDAGLRLGTHALVRAGEVEAALARLDAAEGGRPELEALRVDLLLAAGRTEAAAAVAAPLLESWPDAPLEIGGTYQDHGLQQEALPLLERATAAAPQSIEASFRLASCRERLGELDRAVAEFRALVERAPRFSPALNYLGYLWIERGENLDEALRLVRAAVRLEPDNGAYVDSLGWGEYQLGRYPEAVLLLERAARLEPGDATVLEHLGDARAAAGDLPGARDAYRRALDAGTETAAELERKLARLGGGG
jgi:tetratricopeptide (TPR) repeat protein